MKKLLYLALFTAYSLTSCTLQKRMYSSGFHLEWPTSWGNAKSAKNHKYVNLNAQNATNKTSSTDEFAKAVIANLGNKPTLLKPVSHANSAALNLPKYKRKTAAEKTLAGVDLFVHWTGENPNEIAEKAKKLETESVELTMITNRGIKVWPEGFRETFCTDHWRCRFKPTEGHEITKADIIALLTKALDENIDTIKTENLYSFNGKPAYSLGRA